MGDEFGDGGIEVGANVTGIPVGAHVVVNPMVAPKGMVGLGALLGFKRRGVASVVVVDLIPSRLEKALQIGADSVVNSAEEDVVGRLAELDGNAPRRPGETRPGTDLYLDAAGAPVVVQTVLANVKHGAKLGIVAVHKWPVESTSAPSSAPSSPSSCRWATRPRSSR